MLAILTAFTVSIHYGWLIEPIFGHVHWVHAVHGRFCYLPIVVAAAWFGLRGGLMQAGVISLLVLPLLFSTNLPVHDFVSELAEIVFYFALGTIIGFLVDREFRARRRQQEAQLQVERSQKLSLVGQIAAGVAHEIKNPLSSIKGAADILSDSQTSPAERAEFAGILQGEVRRIDATVTEFLEFARPKQTRLTELNLTETIRTTVRQLSSQATTDKITLDVNTPVAVMVNGDSEKLHQLVLNLVLNAIQASAKGDTVTVATRTISDRLVELAIEDHGAGIPDADREKVFEPFYTTKSSGVGLGLAVVKAIVDDHGGRITIGNAESGKGTRVSVQLPLADSR